MTSITDFTLDHVSDAINDLASQYLPNLHFFWNKAATNVLRKQKADTAGSYLWGDVTNGNPRTLWGYPYMEVTAMASAPAAATAFAVIGDPKKVVFATRGGLRVDLLTEGSVGGVSLAETAQYSLRVIENQDNQVLDTSAFNVIKTNAS